MLSLNWVLQVGSVRSAVSPTSAVSSSIFPADTSVFVADAQTDAQAKASALKVQLDKAISDVSPVLQKAFDENAPIIEQKLKTEVAPAVKQALSDAVGTNEQTGQRRPVVDYGSLDYGHNVAPSGTVDSTSRPKQAKQFKTKTMSKPVRRKPRTATVRTNL